MRTRPRRSARSHKPQYLVAALIPALIIVLSISGFVWAQKDVTVVVDGDEHRMKTQASTVGALLEEAGVSVDADDVVTPALSTVLEDDETVIVRHSVPVVLDLNGSRVPIDVVGETVADALIAAGTDPASNPGVTPSASAPLVAGMTISIPDVFVRVVQREEAVAPPLVTRKEPALSAGRREIVSPGSPGRVVKVYRMLVVSGSEGTPVLTTERRTVEPRARVIAVGTGSGRDAGPKRADKAAPPSKGRRMRVVTTAYSPRQEGLDFTTATGARARKGIIAVDPRVIPFGTKVYVPGYGYAVAADTGGAIKGNRIDLCFETVDECFKWGRRAVTITIVD